MDIFIFALLSESYIQKINLLTQNYIRNWKITDNKIIEIITRIIIFRKTTFVFLAQERSTSSFCFTRRLSYIRRFFYARRLIGYIQGDFGEILDNKS